MTDQGFGFPAPLPADSGWRRWGLPGSWRTFDRMPCFSDSGGLTMPGHHGISDVAFPLHVQGRRPQKVISELFAQPTISLSTLHPFGYPRGARLASGWRPPLARRDSYPQGPFGRFPRLRCHPGLTSSLPPSPGFAWRTRGTPSVAPLPPLRHVRRFLSPAST